jgi:type I restriction enzyme S subunit
MPKNWKTYKLSEVIQIIGGGTPKTSIPEFWNGSIPWLSVKDFQGEQKFVFQTEKTITEEGLKKSSTKILSKGAIIISARGTVGELAVLEKEMTFNQSCYGILPNDKTDNNYLYYLLKQKIRELQGLSYGSVFDTITTKTFDGLDVYLPPLPEQTQIANILSAIDDKIENNLAINKTLEDMAMALYKHWFVDFGPFQDGEFIDSELGLIPKGWEVKIIGNVIDTLGGGTPKTTENSYWENGDILWYSPTDLTRDNAMFSLDSSKRINNLGLLKSSAKLFPPYSLLMSSRATIGALTINTIKASTNQGFITMIPNDNMSVYQLYSWTKWNMDLIISKSNGSTFKEISKANFRSLEIVVGQNIELFLRESKNIFDKVENNIQENQSLTKLRDTLLPKLISGEVRLKEFREGIDAEMNSA